MRWHAGTHLTDRPPGTCFFLRAFSFRILGDEKPLPPALPFGACFGLQQHLQPLPPSAAVGQSHIAMLSCPPHARSSSSHMPQTQSVAPSMLLSTQLTQPAAGRLEWCSASESELMVAGLGALWNAESRVAAAPLREAGAAACRAGALCLFHNAPYLTTSAVEYTNTDAC